MIKAYISRYVEHEHSADVKIETEIESTQTLICAEIVSLLKACHEIRPEETFKAVELFLEENLEND